MSKSKELAKNTIIISIGKISTQIISFFLLPLYTSRISSSAFGEYDYIVTIVSFIIPIITMLLEESMFRFLIDARTDNEKKSIITQTFIFCMISMLLASLIFLLVSFCIDYSYCYELWLFSISALFLALSNSISRGEGRIFLYSVSNFLVSVFTIVGNLFFILALNWEFNALFYSGVIAYLVASIFVFVNIKVWKYVNLRLIDINLLKKMLYYSLPLVPNTISWSIINVSDRIVIMSFIGSSANGVYSVSNRFPNLINNIYSIFNIAWRESSAKMARDNNFEELNNIYRMTTSLLFGTTLCLITGIRLIYPIFINNLYQEGILYVPILALSVFYLSLAGFYGGIFTAFKDTKILGITSFIAAGINVTIDLLLVRYIGLYAAALSTFSSSYFLYFYRKIKVRKYVKICDKSNFIYLCCFVLSLILFELNNSYITMGSFSVAVSVSFVLNRKLLFTFIRILKNKYILQKV